MTTAEAGPAADNSAGLELIGVPFDGMGRVGGQAQAPAALRDEGLRSVFGTRLRAEYDLAVPGPGPERAAVSGLLNEPALLAVVEQLYRRVRACLAAGRFPLVYGGDCAVLLGAVPALRDVAGEAGLVFADGHEDATPMELSRTGEAANMEIALLLGITGGQAPEPLRSRLPALSGESIAMLGQRDQLYRQAAAIPSIAGRVWLRSAGQVSADPAGITREAIRHIRAQAGRWWLHVDLDVLARAEFAACGAPGEVELPGGLTWSQLGTVTVTAMRERGCCGWSIAVYNPDLDPERTAARRIVELVGRTFEAGMAGHNPVEDQ